MKGSNKFKAAILIILLFILLIRINSDFFHYKDEYFVDRTFSRAIDPHGDYVLVREKTLKNGSYTLQIVGESDSADNYYHVYVDGEQIDAGLFPEQGFRETVTFQLEKPLQDFRIDITFGPDSDQLKIETVEVTSPYVPQKEVILYHIVISFFLILLFCWIIIRFLFPVLYSRIFKKLSKPSTEYILLFLLFLTIFTSVPFFNPDYVQTDDGYYHMLRIEGIKESLQTGIFPARIHLYILNDYGYGEGFYYPDLFLYFPAVLRLLGFSILAAYKIFICLCNFFSILSLYFSVSKMAQSRYAGMIAATLFAFAAYRLIDLYYRGAVGEILSFIFIPLVFYGLFAIYTDKPHGWLPFAAGFIGLAFSHMISLALAVFSVLLFVLLNIVTTLRNKQILLSLLKALGMTLLITIVFWLPLIEQLVWNKVTGNVLYSNVSFPIDDTRLLTFQDLFSGFTSWDKVKPFLGYPLLFVPLVRLLLRKKRADCPAAVKTADWLLGFGVLAAVAVTSVFPWENLAWVYNRIQFPWRLLVISSPLLAAAGGILSDAFLKKQHRPMFLFATVVFCVATSQPFFSDVFSNHIVTGYGFALENNRVMGAEYLPQNASIGFVDKNMNTVLCSDDSFENLYFDRSGLRFIFDFRLSPASDGLTTFEVPLLYYYGYQGTISDAAGNTQMLNVYQGAHGFAAVDTDGITEGNITVFYSKTPLQKIADGAGLVIAVACIAYYLWKRNQLKRQNFPRGQN